MTRLLFGKGVNKDLLASELEPGYWSDVLNVRTRNGFDEVFEGVIAKTASATISDNGGAFLFPFGSYFVYGNTTKVYGCDGTTHFDLSIYVPPQTIGGIGRIGANTAEVTTLLPHRLTTGDTAVVTGAAEAAYNSGLGTVTVTSPTKFRYTTSFPIGADATQAGRYVVLASANTGITNAGTYPTGGVLNGIFFISSETDGLFYVSGGIGTQIVRAPFALPAISGARAVRPFKDYLVLLAGTEVYWTDAADPGTLPTTFTAAPTNDAGSVPLSETPGHMIDCKPLGDVNIIYKHDARYAMQYVGGNDVFSFTRIPGEDGLYGPSCVVDTPKGHVFLTQNLDIKIHQGGQATSIAEGRVRKWFASVFNASNRTRVFLCVNPEKSEVWVCFAENSSGACTKALVWNWEADAWGIFSLASPIGGTSGVSFAASGSWPSTISTQNRLLLLTSEFHFNLVDSSSTAYASGTFERTGIDFDDRDTLKWIDRSRWNIDGVAAKTASIYHGASTTADGAVTYASPATYTIGTTDYANSRGPQGRFGAVKVVSASSSGTNPFLIRSADLDLKTGGKR